MPGSWSSNRDSSPGHAEATNQRTPRNQQASPQCANGSNNCSKQLPKSARSPKQRRHIASNKTRDSRSYNRPLIRPQHQAVPPKRARQTQQVSPQYAHDSTNSPSRRWKRRTNSSRCNSQSRPCRPKASLTPTANSHNAWNTSRQSSRSKSRKSACVLQRARANAQRRALARAQGLADKLKGLTSPQHHLTTRNLTKAQTHGAKREPECKEAEEAAATVQKDLVAAGAVVVEAQEATAAVAAEPAAAAAHLEDLTTRDLSSSTFQASAKTDLPAPTTNN